MIATTAAVFVIGCCVGSIIGAAIARQAQRRDEARRARLRRIIRDHMDARR